VFSNKHNCSKRAVVKCGMVFIACRSEANDLALRLARAHTGAHDAIVLD